MPGPPFEQPAHLLRERLEQLRPELQELPVNVDEVDALGVAFGLAAAHDEGRVEEEPEVRELHLQAPREGEHLRVVEVLDELVEGDMPIAVTSTCV